MDEYTPAERAFCVEQYFKLNSVISVQRAFRRKFRVPPRKRIPNRKTINRWVEDFRTSASAENKPCLGQPKTVRTPENIARVHAAFRDNPQQSARRQAAALGLSRESTRRILVSDLAYHPYKLLITQQLQQNDYAQRKHFAEKMLEKLENEIALKDLLMSDEAHFELSGSVNKQNMRYWCAQNPTAIVERPLHSQRVTVWAGVAQWGIIGPYFFRGTVNSASYIQMLNEFVLPELRRRRRLSRTWFQQDGATCHTAEATLAVLRGAFGNRLISRRTEFVWPARSPDMTVPDFFLWGYLKARVYRTQPQTLDELEDRIREEIANLSPVLLEKVFRNFVRRLHACIREDGQHLTDVVFHT